MECRTARLVGWALLGTCVGFWCGSAAQSVAAPDVEPYAPVIEPSNFTSEVNNPYFNLRPGRKFIYLEKGLTQVQRSEIEVLSEKKTVMGVETIVVRSREWTKDVIKEDTYDWYAQDKDGNVWYFGEKVENYKDGKLVNNSGSWEAGVDGALPGIIMLATPKVGESYRHEYYKAKAEDMGTVLSLNERVQVSLGSYDGCLKIRDWSKLETGSDNKYFCPQIGFLVAEEADGLTGIFSPRTELVEVKGEIHRPVAGKAAPKPDRSVKIANIEPQGTNPYFFPLMPGHKHAMERPDHPDGKFRKETVVLDEAEEFDVPNIGKFKTAIVQDEEFLEGVLTQRSRKWVAFDKSNNSVYAFGQVDWDVDPSGRATFTDTWRVGEGLRDGTIAQPVLVMPGTLPDGSTDKIEKGVEISVPAGDFKDCIRLRDPGQPLIKDLTDSVWCSAVGVVFNPEHGKLVVSDALPKDNPASDVSSVGKLSSKPAKQVKPAAKITADEATRIALKSIKGKVTEVKIERKLGKDVFVVEMQTLEGEKDVFVDLESGKVVGTD